MAIQEIIILILCSENVFQKRKKETFFFLQPKWQLI